MTDPKLQFIWDRLTEIQACGLDLTNNVDLAVFHAINGAMATLSITKAQAAVPTSPETPKMTAHCGLGCLCYWCNR